MISFWILVVPPKVHVTNVIAFGGGTIARDDAGGIVPHVHVAVGLKEHPAIARAGRLLSAGVQFVTEMLVVEILAPEMTRPNDRSRYDVLLLIFG
jgi:predicted DNA-binding protein with PD1-like motif